MEKNSPTNSWTSSTVFLDQPLYPSHIHHWLRQRTCAVWSNSKLNLNFHLNDYSWQELAVWKTLFSRISVTRSITEFETDCNLSYEFVGLCVFLLNNHWFLFLLICVTWNRFTLSNCRIYRLLSRNSTNIQWRVKSHCLTTIASMYIQFFSTFMM